MKRRNARESDFYVELGTFFNMGPDHPPSIAYVKKASEVVAMFGIRHKELAFRLCDLLNITGGGLP